MAARHSALAEAKTRLTNSREEAQTALADSERQLAELPPAVETEDKLAAIRVEIDGYRAALAEIRAEAQAIAREAELSNRRLQAIAVDRQGWDERRTGATAQITTLEARTEEARVERAVRVEPEKAA